MLPGLPSFSETTRRRQRRSSPSNLGDFQIAEVELEKELLLREKRFSGRLHAWSESMAATLAELAALRRVEKILLSLTVALQAMVMVFGEEEALRALVPAGSGRYAFSASPLTNRVNWGYSKG